MNSVITSDPLNNFQKEKIQQTIRDMIDDSELLVEITLKSLTSQTVNLGTGAVTRTSDDDTINALRRLVTAEEVKNAGGQLEPEDRVYWFDQADITKSYLQTVDRIVEGTDVLGVIMFAADPLGHTWQMIGRIV
jgi:hypothetical protein